MIINPETGRRTTLKETPEAVALTRTQRGMEDPDGNVWVCSGGPPPVQVWTKTSVLSENLRMSRNAFKIAASGLGEKKARK